MNRIAVIGCGGVGYACRTTTYPLSQIKKGDKAKLFTYLDVREDAMELYGFAAEEELDIFKLLISVSGVGPKAAISILSVMSAQELINVILAEDAKAISRAPGVGAKTAARIVLELHDKLTKETSEESLLSASLPTADVQKHASGNLKEAMEALVVLGYTKAEATKALQSLDPTLGLEDMIRLGLKQLMRNL